MDKKDLNFSETVCPACSIIGKFGDKWTLRVLILLDRQGTLRFNEIAKATPGISQKSLTAALKSLESMNLVNRQMYAQIPPKVEYSLTPLGVSLMIPIYGIVEWTIQNLDEMNGSVLK